MYKIVFISDTHIKNNKYHDEYRILFDKLYEKIKDEKPDYIIHGGDIVHLKTVLSPESVELTLEFLSNLADIAPLIAIPGNHDCNVKNINRLDSITPLVNIIKQNPKYQDKIFYSRNSAVYNLNKDIDVYTWSLLDKENWKQPNNQDKINICVFHGAISGVQTDIGYILEHGDVDINEFKEFDYVFLGDIHKSNQFVNNDPTRVYVGSTIQQNYGETDDKGFMVWNIKSKKDFESKHISIPHIKPFVTVKITEEGELPNDLEIKSQSRVRIVSDFPLAVDKINEYKSYIENVYNPEVVNYVNKGRNTKKVEKDTFFHENVREVGVQEVLITKYLQDYKFSEDVKKKIFEINKKYNEIVLSQCETYGESRFDILELEWSNLYNYGPKNKIDFTKLNNSVGIFGPNYTGKSSIFDTLLLCLFNQDSKPSRKNVFYINENKNKAFCKAKIRIKDKILHIERKFEKYMKKLKGKETEECKVELTFYIEDVNSGVFENKTEETRNQTDLEIQKYIGTIDNFLLSSMSAQNLGLNFLSLGSTDRKKIIAKFLDLDFFEQKFKIAKEDFKELKINLKAYKNKKFFKEIEEKESEINKIIKEIEEQISLCSKIKKEIDKNKEEYYKKKSEIIPIQISESKEQIDREIERIKSEISITNDKITEKENKSLELSEKESKYAGLLAGIDITVLDTQRDNFRAKKKEYDINITELKKQSLELRYNEKKSLLLKEVPCGSEFSHCKFIKDAWLAKENLNSIKEQIKLLEEKKLLLGKVDYENEEIEIDSYYKEYNNALRTKESIQNKIKILDSEISKSKHILKSKESELLELENKKEIIKENKISIEHNKKVEKQIDLLHKEIKNLENKLVSCEAKNMSLNQEKGRLESDVEKLYKEKEIYEDLMLEYSAYDLFLKCFHPNGISYNIIKSNLPVVNSEVQKILSNIVDFDVFLESEGSKLNVYLQHPKFNARPIEGCSGAEKSLAAMAIRLSLLDISSVPKTPIMILDEPGTSFDEKNLDGFMSMLDVIKDSFDVVFLISHMDTLKDTVDSIIEIDKKNGYAKIEI